MLMLISQYIAQRQLESEEKALMTRGNQVIKDYLRRIKVKVILIDFNSVAAFGSNENVLQ